MPKWRILDIAHTTPVIACPGVCLCGTSSVNPEKAKLVNWNYMKMCELIVSHGLDREVTSKNIIGAGTNPHDSCDFPAVQYMCFFHQLWTIYLVINFTLSGEHNSSPTEPVFWSAQQIYKPVIDVWLWLGLGLGLLSLLFDLTLVEVRSKSLV